MSNLESAQAAIQAELSQAKQGLAYYQSHVAALEGALAQLAVIGNASGTTTAESTVGKRAKRVAAAEPVKGRRGRQPKTDKVVKTKQTKGGKSAKGANQLPFTGGEYWPNLVTSDPQSGADILRAAVAGLGFEPSPEQVKKLQQRMTFVLNALVRDKKIQDSGSGRARRFFK